MSEVQTYTVDLFIAGDAAEARRICRQHCMAVGLCVTVTPTEVAPPPPTPTGGSGPTMTAPPGRPNLRLVRDVPPAPVNPGGNPALKDQLNVLRDLGLIP